jgi:hypothetical protein
MRFLFNSIFGFLLAFSLSAPGYAQQTASPTVPLTLVTLQSSLGAFPGLVLTGPATFGEGTSQKAGTVTISVDTAKGYDFLFASDGFNLSEHFSTTSIPDYCSTPDDSRRSAVSPAYACSAPGPWFFPFYELAGVSTESWQFTTDLDPTHLVLSRIDHGLLPPSLLAYSSGDLHFYPGTSTVQSYAYSYFNSAQTRPTPLILTEYSDYSLESGALIPHHIRQSMSGIFRFDIHLTTVVVSQ